MKPGKYFEHLFKNTTVNKSGRRNLFLSLPLTRLGLQNVGYVNRYENDTVRGKMSGKNQFTTLTSCLNT